MKLAQPAWLILLVLIPLLGTAALAIAMLRRNQWTEFVAPRLRAKLLRTGNPLPHWFSLLFLLISCAALIAAMTRPFADAGSRTEKSIGRNVMIAIDLSRSMRVADVKPDRLAQAKVVVQELLDAMPNERIGLIGFAGDAHELAPLTIDHPAVRETVDQVDETWAPRGGSNLADAIHLATTTLRKTGQKRNALVIISDGEQNEGDLEDMLRETVHSGIFILAIGVGTEDGDYVPNNDFPGKRMIDRSGKPVISRLQPDVMRKLAEKTNGRYITAQSGADIPALVKSSIKDMDTFETDGLDRTATIEFYQWLLFPATLFLLGSMVSGTRWRGITKATAAASIIILTPSTTRADDTLQAARNAASNHQFAEAGSLFRKLAEGTSNSERRAIYHLAEADAAYRADDISAACSAYSHALLTDNPQVSQQSHLGIGNALFQSGWKTLSGKRYPSDTTHLPDLNQFDDIVREYLTKMREANPDNSGSSAAETQLKTLTTEWVDAIKHYQSILQSNPDHSAATSNQQLVITYLERLKDLLDQEKQETQDSMPAPKPNDQPPKDDGDNGDDGDKPKDPSKNNGKNPDDKSPPKNGDTNNENSKGDPKDNDQSPSDQGKPSNPNKKDPQAGKKPMESPQEHAKRVLKENADLEKGPITPSQYQFRNPQKDW